VADDEQWWYNTSTGEVEHGAQSAWSDRAGPYASREEAEGAPARIKENSRRIAEEDAQD
jgi:hypothetical protein